VGREGEAIHPSYVIRIYPNGSGNESISNWKACTGGRTSQGAAPDIQSAQHARAAPEEHRCREHPLWCPHAKRSSCHATARRGHCTDEEPKEEGLGEARVGVIVHEIKGGGDRADTEDSIWEEEEGVVYPG
jgi:hypothetical protein